MGDRGATRELKPNIYYFMRRGWYDQLVTYCDQYMSKKGAKDPLCIYWKAVGIGLSGGINESLRFLESLQVRKDMQYAVSIAQLYFLRLPTNSNIDYDAIETISSELNAAEDVSKDAGLILAARFSLYTNDSKDCLRICQKILRSGNSQPTTAIEIEAATIEYWCYISLYEQSRLESPLSSSPQRGRGYDDNNDMDREKIQGLLSGVDISFNNSRSSDQYDIESLMLSAKVKHTLMDSSKIDQRDLRNVLNCLNQVIAMYPGFSPALADKCLLLSSVGEWEQALDTAQRLLDIDRDSLDALKIIAVHAFTQECHSDDAVQKFEVRTLMI